MKNIKILGGVGAILCSISAVPHIGILAFTSGYVLLGIAYKGLSNKLEEERIFTYILIALILDFFASLGIIAGLSVFFLGFLHISSFTLFAFPPLVLGALFVWIIASIAGYFFFQANKTISEKTKEGLFNLSGILMFIGGLTIIIFLIGAFIGWIGYILIAVSFFSLNLDIFH